VDREILLNWNNIRCTLEDNNRFPSKSNNASVGLCQHFTVDESVVVDRFQVFILQNWTIYMPFAEAFGVAIHRPIVADRNSGIREAGKLCILPFVQYRVVRFNPDHLIRRLGS
jgi:hypothetical protein